MAKILLKLHQPYKWKKHNYVTDKDYEEAERVIYNNLSSDKLLSSSIEDDLDWLQEIFKEDESYAFLKDDLSNYIITTFGRIINTKNKKQIQPNVNGNTFTIVVKGTSVNFRKEFLEQGWIYSGAFIKQKYEQYSWRYYQAS